MNILFLALIIFILLVTLYKMLGKNIPKFILRRSLWSSELCYIFRILEQAGDKPLLVGGAVRDYLLGKNPADIDISSTFEPEKIMQVLQKAGKIKCIPTGIKYGTISAIFRGKTFEITTLRADLKTDGRHAQVAFTTDVKLDASRRDFTINALYMNKHGKIYDYFNGLLDLKNKNLHFINDAEKRINEDYLRILRYFRFLAKLGWQPDNKILKICAKLAPNLKNISAERIRDELFKILAAPFAVSTVKLMKSTKVFENIFSKNLNLINFDKFCKYEEKLDKPMVLRRLHILTFPQINSLDLAKILKLSNAEKNILKNFEVPKDNINSIFALKKSLFLYGKFATQTYLLKNHQTFYWLILPWIKTPIMPNLGAELAKWGWSGESIYTALNLGQKLWIDSHFKLSKKDLLKKITAQ